ncbi:MAG: BREX system Lon protease-like protein BrxL [Candidatus Dormibacteraceae bacterium]
MSAELDGKIKRLAGDKVVLKPLTRWNDAYKEFPRYVMEFLCARYVTPENPAQGQARIDKIIQERYVDSGAKELIRHRIREQGTYALIGELKVRYDARRDVYWADIPAIGESTARIAPAVLRRYEDILLTSGAWGTVEVEHEPEYELKGIKYPFVVREFTPFQISRVDLDEFLALREQFTDNEWLDLLIQSIGFNPDNFHVRTKWLFMRRLVPFVEPNYNAIELGPRETGKTYTYRNTSSRSFVISGSRATAASLFYNVNTRRVGVLGLKDVVFFDEIAHAEFDNAVTTLSVLKDYMQTGRFSRLGQEFTAAASIVLGGNIDCDLIEQRPARRYGQLFEPLPDELQDPAFLDRIHAYIPGWELPKIEPENYANGYGFITDYLAEIFVRLRRRNLQTVVESAANLSGLGERNQTAVKKTTAGLLKLLFPHRTPETIREHELAPCLSLANEGRQRVLDQLAIMLPGEFAGVRVAATVAQ